ncbi:MAG: hypothetical protein Q7U66_13415 [Methylobacter sp.]|nr:hypothetical protein [Methylobacter sp.]
MLKTKVIISALTGALALSSGFVLAAEQEQTQQQEQVYGRELMTEQEQEAQRSKMRAAKTTEEREKIRAEQHERMKERAKESGKTLSDKPPVSGGGKGPGGRIGAGGGRNR